MGGHLHKDTAAASQLIAFMVGGLVFVASIGIALYMAGGDGPQDNPVPGSQVEVASLAALLIESPGIGWQDGNDSLQRLGFQAREGVIDGSRLDALRGAMKERNGTNEKVDYDEARDGLNLTGAQDFHLRIRPLSGRGGAWDLSPFQIAYIGDWASWNLVTVANGTNDAMIQAGQTGMDDQMGSQTDNERASLVDLGFDFLDRVYLTPAEPNIHVDQPGPDPQLLDHIGWTEYDGDVYPDDKGYLDDVLPSRIGQYDFLMVGSTVDHSSLTSGQTKDAIRDWVLAGGKLFVMGSDSQNYQWLQPLFHVGVSTVNGGAFVPDPLHPMLNDPNELAWNSYDTHGLAWDLKDQGSGANYDDFVHVVTEDSEDILAYSKSGAFGDGRILLTTWRPKEVFDQMGANEGTGLLENFFTFFATDSVRLEYGPSIPDGVEVAAAVRNAIIEDPDLGSVAVEIQVHLWGQS